MDRGTSSVCCAVPFCGLFSACRCRIASLSSCFLSGVLLRLTMHIVLIPEKDFLNRFAGLQRNQQQNANLTLFQFLIHGQFLFFRSILLFCF